MVRPDTKLERKSRSLNRSRAREMRHAPATTEKLFWNEVRDRKLGGHKFRRQYLIGPYIADYVCVEKKLIVELDGVLHQDRAGYDNARDEFLRQKGYRVIRFKNEDFGDDMAGTLMFLRRELGDTPSPQPSPPLREGEGEVRKNTLAPAQRVRGQGLSRRSSEGAKADEGDPSQHKRADRK